MVRHLFHWLPRWAPPRIIDPEIGVTTDTDGGW